MRKDILYNDIMAKIEYTIIHSIRSQYHVIHKSTSNKWWYLSKEAKSDPILL